tara:strand:+ start:760 stop:1362 length:603 start_codon:yes stop_codon:yes gene_type:complete
MTKPKQIIIHENFLIHKVIPNPVTGIGTTTASRNPLPKYIVPNVQYMEQTGITTLGIASAYVPSGYKFELIDYDKFDEFNQVGIGSTAILFTDAIIAYDFDTKQSTYDLTFAKRMAHRKRRNRRYSEFAPHDDTVAKAIPGSDTDAAEASRAAIRTKYATMQTEIDNASTIGELYDILQKYPTSPRPPEARDSGYIINEY